MARKKRVTAKQAKQIIKQAFSSMCPTMLICSCGLRLRVQFEGLQRPIAEKFIADHAQHGEIIVKTVVRANPRRSTVGEHPF